MPIDKDAQDEISAELVAGFNPPGSAIELADHTRISLDLHESERQPLTEQDIISRIAAVRKPHSLIATLFSRKGHDYTDPIIVCVDSETEDYFLSEFLDTLREANRQILGKYPGLICCFVPEVEDFTGLHANSALKKMTGHFFATHAKDCVFAISYISDVNRDQLGMYVSKSMPSITYYNPRYDKQLGEIPSVYR